MWLKKRDKSNIKVEVIFKGGSYLFNAPFWWSEDACIRYVKDSMGTLADFIDRSKARVTKNVN